MHLRAPGEEVRSGARPQSHTTQDVQGNLTGGVFCRFIFLFFGGGWGVGLNLCLVSDGDVIMRGHGEQVLPHYCNEKDIQPLHQTEKVAIKVPNKVPRGTKKKKTTL